MATLGMVTIKYGNEVLMKVVASCNGMVADKTEEAIKQFIIDSKFDLTKLTSLKVYEIAAENSFGCENCLTILDNEKQFTFDSKNYSLREMVEAFGDHHPDWKREDWITTFNQPRFYSGWKYGTASHIQVIQIKRIKGHRKNEVIHK